MSRRAGSRGSRRCASPYLVGAGVRAGTVTLVSFASGSSDTSEPGVDSERELGRGVPAGRAVAFGFSVPFGRRVGATVGRSGVAGTRRLVPCGPFWTPTEGAPVFGSLT